MQTQKKPRSQPATIHNLPTKTKPNNIGNLSLAAVTGGFIVVRFVLPESFPFNATIHQGLLHFFEAGMVGALADWFAVTALFEHPLGLKIPHTNLLLKNRKSIEENIGEMIRQLFTPDQLREHISQLSVARTLQQSLNNPTIKQYLKDKFREVGQVVAGHIVNGSIKQNMVAELKGHLVNNVDYAEHLGHLIQEAQKSDFIDKGSVFIIDNVITVLDSHSHHLVEYMYQAIDPNMFQRFFVNKDNLAALLPKVKSELAKVKEDPNHPGRAYLKEAIERYSVYLRGHPQTKADVQRWFASLYNDYHILDKIDEIVSQLFATAATDLERRDSNLLRAFDGLLDQVMIHLDNAETREELDKEIRRTLLALIDDKMVGKLANVARGSLEKMSDDMLVEFVKGKVHNDLQFVRLNGALVGGIFGLLIYITSSLSH